MTVDQGLLEYTDYYSFVDLFERQAAHYHDRVFTLYQLPNTSEIEFKHLTYGEFNRISNYLAHEWSSQLEGFECVGFLTDTSLQSLLVMLTLLKLGRIYNPLSPWFPESAITHSLTTTNTQYLIVSEDCRQLGQTCANDASINVKILEPFDVEQLTTLSANYYSNVRSKDRATSKLSDIVLTIYSSGTTGPPKYHRMSNQYLITAILSITQEGKIDSRQSYELDDTILTTSAPFYGAGIILQWSASVVGARLFLFYKYPRNTDDITKDLLAVITKCHATIMTASPLQLEELAKYLKVEGSNDTTASLLKQVKFCAVGGASLSMKVGNFLHSKGLNVRCVFGITEAGAVGASNFSRDNPYWYLLKLQSTISAYCRWEPNGDGLYHLMIRGDCPTLSPAIAKKYGSKEYYPTNDLFQEEKQMPGYWRHIRRRNITIMMSTGIKIDPVSLENGVVNESSIIKRCMAFGDNRSRPGLLIEVDWKQAANYQSSQIVSEVHDAIIRLAAKSAALDFNVIAVPDMVYILPPDKELPVTLPKGTVARIKALKEFGEDIDKLYNNFVECL